MPDNAKGCLQCCVPDEIITEINIPALPENSRETYIKIMDRKVWSFATAAAAVRLNVAGGTVQNIRVVLGGVAPVPLRAFDSELTLRGSNLDENTVKRSAGAVITGAVPLRHNAYKLVLIRNIVEKALVKLKNSD